MESIARTRFRLKADAILDSLLLVLLAPTSTAPTLATPTQIHQQILTPLPSDCVLNPAPSHLCCSMARCPQEPLTQLPAGPWPTISPAWHRSCGLGPHHHPLDLTLGLLSPLGRKPDPSPWPAVQCSLPTAPLPPLPSPRVPVLNPGIASQVSPPTSAPLSSLSPLPRKLPDTSVSVPCPLHRLGLSAAPTRAHGLLLASVHQEVPGPADTWCSPNPEEPTCPLPTAPSPLPSVL